MLDCNRKTHIAKTQTITNGGYGEEKAYRLALVAIRLW